MHNEVKLVKKSMLSIKGKKLYITKYKYVCIVLAISYTKTKPKNDQLTFVKPKIYLIHSMILNECRYPKNSLLDRIVYAIDKLHSLNR